RRRARLAGAHRLGRGAGQGHRRRRPGARPRRAGPRRGDVGRALRTRRGGRPARRPAGAAGGPAVSEEAGVTDTGAGGTGGAAGSGGAAGATGGRADGPVEVALERGAFVVSIDTEMAWGLAHRPDEARAAARRGDYDDERRLVGAALAVFERHRNAATWALVGHLFLDRCEAGPDGRPHPDLARPAYGWLGDRDWFAIDPCATLDAAPAFYGRDLVERIRACPVEQELACHGFSHLMA